VGAEFRVHHVVLLRFILIRLRSATARRRRRTSALRSRPGGFVQFFRCLVRSLFQFFHRRLDGGLILTFARLVHVRNGRLQGGHRFGAQLFLVFGNQFFHLVGQVFAAVFQFHQFSAVLVFRFVI